MDNSKEAGDKPAGPGTRGPEVIVAAGLLGLGGLVIADSLRVGIGWAEDGPRSGYFPFYIGVLLAGAAAFILLQQLLSRAKADPEFASREQLASVWSIAWPMTVYVASIAFVGIYLASFVLIAFFMRRHGTWKWPPVLGIAIGVPLFFFIVFEKWFLVLLPKGPIERLFGL